MENQDPDCRLQRSVHLPQPMKAGSYDPELSGTTTDTEGEDRIASTSAQRINKLTSTLGLDRHLEIGVETGHTFLQVRCRQKTGVDPAFRFDWQQHQGQEGIELHSIPSDDFFAHLDCKAQYDLIFIDGLHTYEQTYRDIPHALRHSHPGTILLIDDTVPSDVFSSCRDQQQCLALRTASGNPHDFSWHGDTYKVVPLLSAFNPELRLLTLMDGGNPQTLAWRPLKPVQEDPLRTMQAMWAIQNMAAADYIWFLDNISLYNPISELTGLEEVISSLSTTRPPSNAN